MIRVTWTVPAGPAGSFTERATAAYTRCYGDRGRSPERWVVAARLIEAKARELAGREYLGAITLTGEAAP